MEASKLAMTSAVLLVSLTSSSSSSSPLPSPSTDVSGARGRMLRSWDVRQALRAPVKTTKRAYYLCESILLEFNWEEFRLYAVPAAIYLLNDNILYLIYSMLDQAATFEVLSNLKIVATSFLYKFLLEKDISRIQWLSLGMLGVGSVRFPDSSSSSAFGREHSLTDSIPSQTQAITQLSSGEDHLKSSAPPVAIFLIVLYCWVRFPSRHATITHPRCCDFFLLTWYLTTITFRHTTAQCLLWSLLGVHPEARRLAATSGPEWSVVLLGLKPELDSYHDMQCRNRACRSLGGVALRGRSYVPPHSCHRSHVRPFRMPFLKCLPSALDLMGLLSVMLFQRKRDVDWSHYQVRG
jgi:hypothetical protein